MDENKETPIETTTTTTDEKIITTEETEATESTEIKNVEISDEETLPTNTIKPNDLEKVENLDEKTLATNTIKTNDLEKVENLDEETLATNTIKPNDLEKVENLDEETHATNTIKPTNLEKVENLDEETLATNTIKPTNLEKVENLEKTNTDIPNLEPTTTSTSEDKRPKSSASCCSTGSFVVIDTPSGRASRNSNPEPEEEMDSPSTTPPPRRENVFIGRCKWFNVAKGWGFIAPKDGGQEVFVHQSVIKMTGYRSLALEEEVEYEVKETERGLEATCVTGRNGKDCAGHGPSQRRLRQKRRRMRCYNCGEFANHIAAHCHMGPLPKLCHLCKMENHLAVDCPNKQVRNETDDENVVDNRKVDEENIQSKQCVIA